MGKKYLIELEEPEMFDERKFYQCTQMPWWAVSENIVENLTPYTEPDTGAIREEAFKSGYNSACNVIDVESKTNTAYQKGLSDAWEAARKIDHMSDEDIKNVFGCGFSAVFETIGASEAIEKIRQYEQEQDAEIKVGDEVIYNGTTTCVVFSLENDKRYASIIDADGIEYSADHRELTKTGRHFPEIAAVLEKMREGQDG